MAISVRMDPLLEKEMALAAKRKGLTKSQFVINAVQTALGKRDPHALMNAIVAEEEQRAHGPAALDSERRAATAFEAYEQPYDTDASRAQLLNKLKDKHGYSGAC